MLFEEDLCDPSNGTVSFVLEADVVRTLFDAARRREIQELVGEDS